MNQPIVAFSPCPNDTFAFDAWVNQKIASSLRPTAVLADIQQLNSWAYQNRYPVTKVSTFCLGKITNHYRLLPSGAAICLAGPKIIAKEPCSLAELKNKRLLIAGLDTTSYLLLKTLCPEALETGICRYDEMLSLLSQDVADCALIIHETRFTFEQAGFHEVVDLGELFFQNFGCHVPLGVVVAKNELYEEAARALQASIQFAFDNPLSSLDYVLSNSQEKDALIVQKHIQAYVNQETLRLSHQGYKAIQTLFSLAIDHKLLPKESLSFYEADLLCHP